MTKSSFKKLIQEIIQSENLDLSGFKQYFKYTWYLVDGDGYSVVLLYNPELCLLYENRKSGTFHIDVVDPLSFSKDLHDFIHQIDKGFNKSLSPFRNQMIEEIERVILLFNNQSN